MHLCEVRRFMRNFCVYVNDPLDIKILKQDERFHVHAVYNSSKGLMGIEYSFKCTSHTIIGANKYVNKILKKEREIYGQLPAVPVARNKRKA